jgi:squalene-associated FAD-dependent desaturase
VVPANIAIVGGGYAGLAAAVRIVELGGRASVFESGPVLGGRARRITYQDRVLDNGQHILSGAYTELLRLMDVVGVSGRAYERVPLLLSIPPHFRLRAALLPAPLHMAFALLTANGLSWSDRLDAIRFMSALKRSNFVVDARLTVSQLLALHGQSADLTKYLWQPLTISALNTPLASASAQVFVNVLRDALAGAREASDLLLPKVDLSALFPEPAAAWLAARGASTETGVKVTEIVPGADNVVVRTKGAEHAFDAVIVSVGPHQREGLLPTDPNAARQSSCAYEPIITIYLGFDSDSSLPTPMLGQTEGVVQWFFDRRALSAAPHTTEAHRAKPRAGHAELIIAAVISASGEHETLSHAELAALAVRELNAHLPDLPAPVWHKVIHEKFATFACTVDAPRPSAATTHPRVWLAADDVQNPQRAYPATLEGAVRNGVAAAELAMAALAKDPPPTAMADCAETPTSTTP